MSVTMVRSCKDALHEFFWANDDDMLLPLFQYFDVKKQGILCPEEIFAVLKQLYPQPHRVGELNMIYSEIMDGQSELNPSQFMSIMKKSRHTSSGLGRLKLLEVIGGKSTILKLVDKFYSMVATDELLGEILAIRTMSLENIILSQYKYMYALLGGHKPWEGRTLHEAHKGFGIKNCHFDRWLHYMKIAAIETGKTREYADEILDISNSLRHLVVDRHN